MSTIKDLVDGFASLVDGFDGMLCKTMEESRGDVYDLVTDQLYSGVNGRDKPLRPTYLHDPWFKSDEAGKWKNNGKGYAMWKKEEHPPTLFRSFLSGLSSQRCVYSQLDYYR